MKTMYAKGKKLPGDNPMFVETSMGNIIEVHEIPASFLEFHAAFNWPARCYAGNVIQDWDGEWRDSSLLNIPSVPGNWV